jgi:hypothetical protein
MTNPFKPNLPADLDAPIPPPPKPELPTMLGFICIAGMVLYPIFPMRRYSTG